MGKGSGIGVSRDIDARIYFTNPDAASENTITLHAGTGKGVRADLHSDTGKATVLLSAETSRGSGESSAGAGSATLTRFTGPHAQYSTRPPYTGTPIVPPDMVTAFLSALPGLP